MQKTYRPNTNQPKPSSAVKKHPPLALWLCVVALAVLSVGLMTGLWIVSDREQTHRATLENTYQSAFYDAVQSTSQAEQMVGCLLCCEDSAQCAVMANQLAGMVEHAAGALDQLPYAGRVSTAKFLRQTGDFARQYATRLVRGQSTTEQDIATLEHIEKSLRELGQQMAGPVPALSEGYRFGDYIDRPERNKRDCVGCMLDDIEGATSQYPPMCYDGLLADGLDERTVHGTEGRQMVGLEVARQRAAEVCTDCSAGEFGHIGDTTGLIPAHEFLSPHGTIVAVSQRGGRVLSILGARTPTQTLLSRESAQRRAEEFCASIGMQDMQVCEYFEAGNVAFVQLVPVVGGIKYLTDVVHIKLALDDGEVLGMDARQYICHHQPRNLAARISQGSALMAARRLDQVSDVCLVLVADGCFDARLAYQISGTRGDRAYRIFVDADNGRVLEVCNH